MSSPKIPDLPPLENLPLELQDLQRFLEKMRELVQTREPVAKRIGNELDKFVSRRELVQSGFSYSSGMFGSGGVSGIGSISGTGGTTSADPTPPPTPSGLVVTAGLAYLYIGHDTPTYSQGHGHDRTIAYGAKWPASVLTAPTFTDAVRLFDFQGTIGAYPTEFGTRWCIWVKWQSIDGYLSTSPAGGANGVQATTGKIGNTDLGPLIVQAGNIALQAIDSSKMTMTDFSTIADNPTFEAGDVGWIKEGNWTIVNDPVNALNGSWCARANVGVQALRNLVSIPTVVGDEFYAEVMIKAVGVTSSTGAAVRVTGTDATGAEVYQSNGNFISGTSAYAKSSLQVLIPPNAIRLRVEIVSLTTAGTIYVDNIRFQRKLTLNHLAAGSIAVGTAAIQNGAIVNVMIGTAAIDDAKIANLSAAKLTAGDGTIGGTLKSTNYVAGVSGWVLQPSGFVEVSNVVARGAVYATAGSIGGIGISAAGINSASYAAGSAGFSLNNSTGSAEFNNVTVRGAVYPSSGAIPGALLNPASVTVDKLNVVQLSAISSDLGTATAGSLTVNTSGFVRGGQTAWQAGTGFFLGYSGGAYKFSIGNPAGAYMAWDGANLMFGNPTFDTFSASIPGGDILLGVGILLGAGTQSYGSRSVSIVGGRAPFTIIWTLNIGWGGNQMCNLWISSGTSTSATVLIAGNSLPGNSDNFGRLTCHVKDSNERTSFASITVTAHHNALSGSGGGGDAP